MKITVRLFARARDLAGCDSVTVEVPDGATVMDLREVLARDVSKLAEFSEHCLVAVGGEYVVNADVLPEGADVALIPPVSGGE